jgi:Galactose binding lectin domain
MLVIMRIVCNQHFLLQFCLISSIVATITRSIHNLESHGAYSQRFISIPMHLRTAIQERLMSDMRRRLQNLSSADLNEVCSESCPVLCAPCSVLCAYLLSISIDGHPSNPLTFIVVNQNQLVCCEAAEHGNCTLSCPDPSTTMTIDFASYGRPNGMSGVYAQGSCHSAYSMDVMTLACEGKNSCTVTAENVRFGDPCSHQTKKLSVQARCTLQPAVQSSTRHKATSLLFLRIDNLLTIADRYGYGRGGAILNLGEVWLMYRGKRVLTPDPVMSSSSPDSPPSNCADGLIGTICHSSSNNDRAPSLYINVSGLVFDSIRVLNRPDCCQSRIYGASLWLQTRPDPDSALARGQVIQKWIFNNSHTINANYTFEFMIQPERLYGSQVIFVNRL